VGNNRKRQGRQRGAAAVEFALVAVLFFTLLMGIMELGRFLYLYDTVQEVTRRAAREAVVRDFTTEQGKIQRAAVLQDETSTGTVSLLFGGEITNLVVNIEYLNGSLASASPMPTNPADNIAACADSSRVDSCIRYVRVKVCAQSAGGCDPVKYVPMIGLFAPDPNNPLAGMQMIDLRVDIPDSTVTMPAESLGYIF
jgi:hypothetical protein